MSFLSRLKSGIQIVVGGHSQGRIIVKGATVNSGAQRPKQGEEWLHAFNTMPWLRANVGKIAGGVAGLEWGITRTTDAHGMTIKRPDIQKGNAEYRRKSLAAMEEEGKAEAIFDHPFLTLWKNPCPALPGNAARKLGSIYYDIVGEVFFVVDRGPRDGWIKGDFTGRPLPTALWPIPPMWVKRFPTPDNPTFEIRHAGLQLNDIPMSEVLWLKDPDPVNPYGRGVGLFNALSDELDSDENAAKMVSYSFYNRNRPDVLVSIPGADDKELKAFRNEWVANLQGVQNTLKSHFVNVEANVQQIGFDAREMQVTELRQHTRDTIRQVPGVPPEMLGIQDQSNRSTIEAAEFIFNKHVIEPRAEVWREFLSSQVLVEYDPRAVLDYVSPVQEDKNFTMSLVTARPEVVRVNEARKLAGLPALTEAEGGKMFFVNGAFVPTLVPPAAGAVPGAPVPGGGGVPGIPDGGINVPGSPIMHLSVPGAAQAAPPTPAGGMPPAQPENPSAPPDNAGGPPPEFHKGIEKGGAVREAARAFRTTIAEAKRTVRTTVAEAKLTADQCILVSKWARMNNHALDLDLVSKMAPIPISDKRAEEWARRACAHLDGFSTKGWDAMFGPWTTDDDELIDRLLADATAEAKGYEDQPRNDKGEWTSEGNAGGAGAGRARESFHRRVDGDGGSAGAKLPAARSFKSKPAELAGKLRTDGGFTVDPRTGDYPSDGFMVSPYKDRETKIAGKASEAEIKDFAERNADLLSKPGHHIGGWFNPDDQHTYLDVSIRESTLADARATARKNDQLSVFDLATFTTYPTDETKAPRITIVVKGFEEDQHPRAADGKFTDGADEPPVSGESDGSLRQRLARNEARGMARQDRVTASFKAEPTTPPANPPAHDPDVEHDGDGDGVTDSARVGVPADEVPPPPTVPRLPNLTPEERAHEEAFAKAYEADPDGKAREFLAMVKADPPPKFEADMAKMLYAPWQGGDKSPEERAEMRSTMNTSLHQVADAIAKRAFVMHLDSMSDSEKSKGLLVTVGGCGAGKGFALKNLAKEGFSDFNSKNYGAVWDSAGDQNATENPWLLAEAEKRGIPVTYAYVSADPEVTWAGDETRGGVVQRAIDPKDGRMVDAKVFADSYVIGARNHSAFAEANKGKAKFVYVESGKKITRLDGVPKSDLSRDRRKLNDFAVEKVAKLGDAIPARIKRGALIGQRIWPRGRRSKV